MPKYKNMRIRSKNGGASGIRDLPESRSCLSVSLEQACEEVLLCGITGVACTGIVAITCIAYTMKTMLGVPTKRICTAQNLKW